MNSFIDILSRLIIATITFVAPMIVFCFGIFFDALKLNVKEKEEKHKILIEDAISQINTLGANSLQVIKETAKKIEDKWYQKFWNVLMHPKVQIVLIFSFLFLALGFLMFSHLVLDNVWNLYNYNLWRILIHFSFWSYFLSVVIIILFVINVIIMKEKIEKNKS